MAPEREIARSNTCLNEPGKNNKMSLAERNFEKLKRNEDAGPMGGRAAVNASCKLWENASDGIYGMKFRWFTLFPSFILRRTVETKA